MWHAHCVVLKGYMLLREDQKFPPKQLLDKKEMIDDISRNYLDSGAGDKHVSKLNQIEDKALVWGNLLCNMLEPDSFGYLDFTPSESLPSHMSKYVNTYLQKLQTKLLDDENDEKLLMVLQKEQREQDQLVREQEQMEQELAQMEQSQRETNALRLEELEDDENCKFGGIGEM